MVLVGCGGSSNDDVDVDSTQVADTNQAADTIAPVLTLIGSDTVILSFGESYSDQGVTVVDNVDTNLAVTTTGSYDVNTAGTYTITYTVSDSAGNTRTISRTIIVKAEVGENEVPAGNGYIFDSANEDTFYMQYWGDTWGTETEYTDQPSDTTYAKALEISKSASWGTVVAWGNEIENTINISSYTTANFKVKTDTFESVQVFVQSATLPESNVVYDLTTGVDLGNGWVEMQVPLPGFTDMTWFSLNFIGDDGTTVLLADLYFTGPNVEPPVVEPPVEPQVEPPAGDAYIFDSNNDDSYSMEYWGDAWGTGTVFTDQPSDMTYAKALEISKSDSWGTVVAWGNEPENSIDISAYTHAKFKVKTDSFDSVQVFVQSKTQPETNLSYDLSSGVDLGNGWVEMQVALPGFTDMTWFALNFIGDAGTTVLLADVHFTTSGVVPPVEPPAGDAYIFESANEDSYFMEYWGDTWGTGTAYTDQPTDNTYAKALEISKSDSWGTVVAWGNEPENAINISPYTHAKFKVKTSTFELVQVFVQSKTLPESNITYDLSAGVDLGNGWVEMQVALPGFTDMTWFALNFTGDAGTTVLLADLYFTTLDAEPVTGPPEAAPVPPSYADEEVIVLYSDSLTQDSFIGVWNANWWNAPTYSEGDVDGNHFAKYEITAGGVEGGVTGLEFGYENGELDASSTTTLNFDLFVESGISRVEVQLVSKDGGSKYTIDSPTTGSWVTYELLYSDLIDNDAEGPGVLNSGLLQSIGIQLWGDAGQAVYVDNIYFSGESIYYELAVTVTDADNAVLPNANVSVGNVSAMTNASGVAVLTLPEGEHKVVVDANGFGVAQGNKVIAGGDTSLSISVVPLNSGPVSAAPAPTETDAQAFVLYSDALTVDKPISYWSDNWWNAPTFSEITIGNDKIAKLQIIPDGVAGGVTGIQYGIEGGAVDASTATGLRFNMYATAGITQAVFQIVSNSGPGISTMLPVVTEQWITVELPFASLVDSTGNFDPAKLTQLGVQLWGTTSDAVYIDNIYFY